MIGKIVKQISNDYTVLSNDKLYVCKARGKFKKLKESPLVGDSVIFDEVNKYILEINKRKNYLIRPSIANLDMAIIITSLKNPNFSTNLLDKFLTIIEYNNIKPIIIFTKYDLLNDEEKENIKKYINYYKKYYQCYINTEIDKISKIFKNKISVFTGQTGAGKSTLLNKLDTNLNLKTDEISKALGRGKHTTRHTELINLLDGFIADTPGFSSLDFIGMDKIDIRDNFIDFNNYRDLCKYNNCLHDKEDKCIIKEKVSTNEILSTRYENYIKFLKEKDDKYR